VALKNDDRSDKSILGGSNRDVEGTKGHGSGVIIKRTKEVTISYEQVL
jgi:hypothetical protein